MWGRFLGLAFVVPGVYFVAKGFVNPALGQRLGLLLVMGGTQAGFLQGDGRHTGRFLQGELILYSNSTVSRNLTTWDIFQQLYVYFYVLHP